jgi:hypothetical protein
LLRGVVLYKFTDVSEVLAMEVTTISETSVNYQNTRRNNPEDSQHIRAVRT